MNTMRFSKVSILSDNLMTAPSVTEPCGKASLLVFAKVESWMTDEDDTNALRIPTAGIAN